MRKKNQRQYTVINEQDEDGYFVASVPALPGCHTQAKSIVDLKVRVREAIQLCLNVAKEDPGYCKRIIDFAYQPSFIGLETITL